MDIDNPPSCRRFGPLQKNNLKDAALVRLPRAYARHVQEGFQAYAVYSFNPEFLLIFSSIWYSTNFMVVMRLRTDNRTWPD
jgi:hypothetical protein